MHIMNSDSTYVDGLLPVLQKLAKSDICSTIIPGRLYPTRTSHGKVLELRVCCQSNSNDISDSSNDISVKGENSPFHSIPISNRRSIDEKLFDSSRNVKNILDKNNNSSRKNPRSNSSSSSSNYINNNNNSSDSNMNSNSNSNNSSGFMNKIYSSSSSSSNNNNSINSGFSDSNGNNSSSHFKGKSSHRVLARNGSLVQEVCPYYECSSTYSWYIKIYTLRIQ